MVRVIIESPYAGDIERNLRYLRACMKDALARGEAPYASHALYTQPGVLDDNDAAERRLGIDAGFEWWLTAERIVFYTDLGWSNGMQAARQRAHDLQREAVVRQLGGEWVRP